MQAVMTRETVRSLFAKQREEIAKALPSHINADTFIRVVLTAVNKTPKLMECTPESLVQCSMDLAQLGLVADSVMGLAYLIPFNDYKRGMICTLIVGYQGFVELAYRHPKVKAIRWHVVHAKDRFDYVDGLEPRLVHTPNDDEDPGPLVKAYAICQLEGGETTWAVLNRREVLKARAVSKSTNSEYSPWSQWEEAMWAKTAVKAMLKRVPKSRDLAEAYAKDADDAVIDVASQVMNQTPVLAAPPEAPEPPPAPTKVEEADDHPELAPATPPPPKPKAKVKAAVKAPEPPKAQAPVAVAPPPAPAPAAGEPPAELFPEAEEHRLLRRGIAERGLSEGAVLDYLRGEQLVEEDCQDLRMIAPKRAVTITMSLDTIKQQLGL